MWMNHVSKIYLDVYHEITIFSSFIRDILSHFVTNKRIEKHENHHKLDEMT